MDFAIPFDHWVKLKETKKGGRYFELAGEPKKLWNMKVAMIPVVVGARSTVTKGLLKGGSRGVMVIDIGNRHSDTSSNPGPV